MAEEVTNFDIPPQNRYDDYYMWTFYKLASRDHYAVLRWYGCSSGSYGVAVRFYEIEELL